MTEAEKLRRQFEEDLEIIRGFRLLDDDFMTKCFDGSIECVELVLRILLNKPDLRVLEVRTQVFIGNLQKRAIRLDVLATDSSQQKYNIELQRSNKGAGQKRARFHSSMIDAKWTEKGTDFDDLPETFTIFITEHDVIGDGRPIYQIERCILENGRRFNDGAHILYVNGAYRGENPIGWLMHDFFCTSADEMHYDVLAERVKYFKESKEGVASMCKVIEEMRNESFQNGKLEGFQEGVQKGIQTGRLEGITQNAIENARRMLSDGISPKKISEYTNLEFEKVLGIREEMELQ